MKDGILDAYELVLEGKDDGKGVVTSTQTKKAGSGAGFDDDKKQAPNRGASAAASHVKKPQEAPKNLTMEYKEIESMLPKSKFDELFKSQLVEEEDLGISSEESPLENTGEDTEFNDENGDFPSEGGDDVGDEVDVATELRTIIDRLTEIAERLGAYEGDRGEDGDSSTGEMPEDVPAGETPMAEESVEPIKEGKQDGAGGKLAPFNRNIKSLQGKSFAVKSAFKPSTGKAKNSAGPGKGAHDGKLAPAKKTTLGPKMSLKADAKGPMGKTGAGIFDAV